LAAARLRVFAASELVARLDDPIALLDAGGSPDATLSFVDGIPNRHGTIEGTVGWSYRTLGPDQARLLRCLAVFAGPIDLSSIERLTGADPFGALAVLVDKSLVQVDLTPSGTRYRLLGPIPAYAPPRPAGPGRGAG